LVAWRSNFPRIGRGIRHEGYARRSKLESLMKTVIDKLTGLYER
jgi:hypothetical protein